MHGLTPFRFLISQLFEQVIQLIAERLQKRVGIVHHFLVFAFALLDLLQTFDHALVLTLFLLVTYLNRILLIFVSRYTLFSILGSPEVSDSFLFDLRVYLMQVGDEYSALHLLRKQPFIILVDHLFQSANAVLQHVICQLLGLSGFGLTVLLESRDFIP